MALNMTKIEELIESVNNDHWFAGELLHKSYIGDLMKKYAEFYAQKCLEIAESHIFEEVYCAEIYPTEIKLPDHD